MLNKFAVWKRNGNEMSHDKCHKSLRKFHAMDQIDVCKKNRLNVELIYSFLSESLKRNLIKTLTEAHWSFNLRFQDAIKNKLAQTASRRIRKLN